jgi:hypothetical protein
VHTGLVGDNSREFATTPLRVEGAVLKGVFIDEAVEMLVQGAGHFAWAPGARAIQQALGPLMRKALHPFSERGIGQMESLGDGVNMLACHNLTDGLRPAKDPDLFRLLQYGL